MMRKSNLFSQKSSDSISQTVNFFKPLEDMNNPPFNYVVVKQSIFRHYVVLFLKDKNISKFLPCWPHIVLLK